MPLVYGWNYCYLQRLFNKISVNYMHPLKQVMRPTPWQQPRILNLSMLLTFGRTYWSVQRKNSAAEKKIKSKLMYRGDALFSSTANPLRELRPIVNNNCSMSRKNSKCGKLEAGSSQTTQGNCKAKIPNMYRILIGWTLTNSFFFI